MTWCRKCAMRSVPGLRRMSLEGKTRKSNREGRLAILLVLLAVVGCQRHSSSSGTSNQVRVPPRSTELPLSQVTSPQIKPFLASAIEQTKITTGYNPAYVKIDYPAAMYHRDWRLLRRNCPRFSQGRNRFAEGSTRGHECRLGRLPAKMGKLQTGQQY